MNTPDAGQSNEQRGASHVATGDLLAALKRLIAANESLAEISPNRVTYYEDSPTKSAECHRRWVELNHALCAGREAANTKLSHAREREPNL